MEFVKRFDVCVEHWWLQHSRTENSLRRTWNDVFVILQYVFHTYNIFFDIFHVSSDRRQFAVVALLDPEGFTSNKLPARPDVIQKFMPLVQKIA